MGSLVPPLAMSFAGALDRDMLKPSSGGAIEYTTDVPPTDVPPMRTVVLGIVVTALLSGVVQGGTNVQRKLVDDRGLRPEQAETIVLQAMTVMSVVVFFVSVVDFSPRSCGCLGLVVEVIGLCMMLKSKQVVVLTLGFGFVGTGGTIFYLAALRVASASKSSLAMFIVSSMYTMSSYTTYFLFVPSVTLERYFFVLLVAAAWSLIMVWFSFPSRGDSQEYAWRRPPAFLDIRYVSFCIAFGLSTAVLSWGLSAFSVTVIDLLGKDDSFGLALQFWFPLAANSGFLVAPLMGMWVERFGCLGLAVAQVVWSQLLMACYCWPSRMSMCIVMPLSAVTSTLVYGLQSVYLLQFPQVDFSVLLSGTFFTQSMVLVVMNDGPTQGYWAALTWCALMAFGYSWPVAMSRYSKQQRIVVASKLLSDDRALAGPGALILHGLDFTS